MGVVSVFSQPEPLTIEIYTTEYRELVKKAGLYDELVNGKILLNNSLKELNTDYDFLKGGGKNHG